MALAGSVPTFKWVQTLCWIMPLQGNRGAIFSLPRVWGCVELWGALQSANRTLLGWKRVKVLVAMKMESLLYFNCGWNFHWFPATRSYVSDLEGPQDPPDTGTTPMKAENSPPISLQVRNPREPVAAKALPLKDLRRETRSPKVRVPLLNSLVIVMEQH